MSVLEVIDNGPIVDQQACSTSLDSATGTRVEYAAPVLNLFDSGPQGHFGDDAPFGVVKQGRPTARITGKTWQSIVADGTGKAVIAGDELVNDTISTSTFTAGQIALTQGCHAFEAVMFEHTGGSYFELLGRGVSGLGIPDPAWHLLRTGGAKGQVDAAGLQLVGTPTRELPPADDWISMMGRDIGNPSAPGSATYDAGLDRWTVRADGRDIWDNADQFHYVYRRLSGDGEITARVVGLSTPAHEWAKAGVMIREGLGADSKHAVIVVTPLHGVAFQYRSSTGGLTDPPDGGTAAGLTAPMCLRLQRQGDTFRGYYYANGKWVLQHEQTIPMGKDVYIGLATTSHTAGQLVTAVFDRTCP